MGNRHRIVSVSPDRSEAIITEDGVSQILPGLSDEEIADLSRRDAAGYSCRWPPYRLVADVEGLCEEVWSTEDDLASLPDDRAHRYIICASRLRTFFEFVCRGKGKNFTPVFVYGRHVLLGPRIDSETRNCPSCFGLNILNNLPSLKARWSRSHQIIFPPQSREAARRAIDALILLRESDRPLRGPHHTMVLDLIEGEIAREANVLRLCLDCEAADGKLFHEHFDRPGDLVGEFVGAARRIARVDARPRSLAIAAADSELLSGRDLGGGVARQFPSAARKALFETIERLVSNHVAAQARLSKYSDLDAASLLPAGSYRPYSESQYCESEFPLARFEPQAEYLWLEGARLSDKRSIFVPADFVCSDLRAFSRNLLSPPASNGTAAYDSPAKALDNALLELVERDVVTRCWYRRHLASLESRELLPKIESDFLREGLGLKLLLCREVSFGPVVVALIYDRESMLGAAGSGIGSSLFSACESAAFNAATMFAHREQSEAMVPLGEVIQRRFPEAADRSVAIRWKEIARHYDPIVFNLSDDLLRSRNIFVTRAWSDCAVSFPSATWPLPRNLWTPTREEESVLEREKGLF